jgi:hypothetical protein
LKATKGIDVGIWKLHDELDWVLLTTLCKFFPVVRRLGAEEVLLNSEWMLLRSDKNDDKNWMRFTVFLAMILGADRFSPDLLPWNGCRALTSLSSEVNALIRHLFGFQRGNGRRQRSRLVNMSVDLTRGSLRGLGLSS